MASNADSSLPRFAVQLQTIVLVSPGRADFPGRCTVCFTRDGVRSVVRGHVQREAR